MTAKIGRNIYYMQTYGVFAWELWQLNNNNNNKNKNSIINGWLPLWSSVHSFWLQNWDVLCFLCGTNWIYICYVEESRPPLWSSGQSSWLLNGEVLFPVRYELNLYMLCRRKWTASVVQWSESLAADPEVPSSIPGATRFSEKLWVWNGVNSASWAKLRSYLKEKVAASV
jgi:hypothetical protein